MSEQKGRVLIVGLGISGIATAGRLHRAGWRPVIIERAERRREGGYFIALFGAGRIAARSLGIIDRLHDRSPSLPAVDFERNGRRHPGMGFDQAPGKPWMMRRPDVEQAAWSALSDGIEIRYSTTPTAIRQDADGVDVDLTNNVDGLMTTERFDLVVGADGVRSTVRRLVFGPDEQFLRPMNYMIAAYQYPGSAPAGLLPGQTATFFEPGRALMVFAFRDHDPTVMMTWRIDGSIDRSMPPHEQVEAVFGPAPYGETLGDVVSALGRAQHPLVDSTEQVKMDTWRAGRVILLGDSAWCATLYSGMGVSAGLIGADLLGATLERHPRDLEAALGEWETTLRPHIESFQASAFDQRAFFVAESGRDIRLRRLLTRAMQTPLLGALLAKVMPIPGGKSKDVDVVGSLPALAPPSSRLPSAEVVG